MERFGTCWNEHSIKKIINTHSLIHPNLSQPLLQLWLFFFLGSPWKVEASSSFAISVRRSWEQQILLESEEWHGNHEKHSSLLTTTTNRRPHRSRYKWGKCNLVLGTVSHINDHFARFESWIERKTSSSNCKMRNIDKRKSYHLSCLVTFFGGINKNLTPLLSTINPHPPNQSPVLTIEPANNLTLLNDPT